MSDETKKGRDVERRGTIEPRRSKGSRVQRWWARIQLADGSRPRYPIPEGYSEARARECAAAWQEREDRDGLLLKAKLRKEGKVADGESAADWFDRYYKRLKARGLVTHKEMRSRLARYVVPFFAGKTMTEITRDDLRAVVASLDERIELAKAGVKEDGKAIRFRWTTAENVWGDVTAAFAEACSSKDASLRVLDPDKNPTNAVRGPETGDERPQTILYPDEFLALVSCKRVPLYRRRLYAVATYLGARSNELAALTASDVDFAHRRFQITKQLARKTKKEIPTKTRRTRSPDLEPTIEPLLRALIAQPHRGRLLHMPPDEDRAELLRKDMQTAGLTRPRLYVDNEMEAPFNFHGLRHTSCTWMAIRGDDPLRIQWRGGHTDFATTQGYIANAQRLAAGFGDVFPELPPDLCSDGVDNDLSKNLSSEVTGIPETDAILAAYVATPTGIEGRDEEPPGETTANDDAAPVASTRRATSKSAEAGGVDAPVDDVDDEIAAVRRDLDRAQKMGAWADVARHAKRLDALEETKRARGNVIDLAGARAKRGAS